MESNGFPRGTQHCRQGSGGCLVGPGRTRRPAGIYPWTDPLWRPLDGCGDLRYSRGVEYFTVEVRVASHTAPRRPDVGPRAITPVGEDSV
jgi:hypothetical protein